jgi:hypothetical protein
MVFSMRRMGKSQPVAKTRLATWLNQGLRTGLTGLGLWHLPCMTLSGNADGSPGGTAFCKFC